MVHLILRPSDDDPNLLQIALHEDFYHPTDIAALIIPPLIPVVKLLQKVGTIASIINARIAGLLGTNLVSLMLDGASHMFDLSTGFWSTKSGNEEGIRIIVSQARLESTPENESTQKSKTD